VGTDYEDKSPSRLFGPLRKRFDMNLDPTRTLDEKDRCVCESC
jgi:hypothetical protein